MSSYRNVCHLMAITLLLILIRGSAKAQGFSEVRLMDMAHMLQMDECGSGLEGGPLSSYDQDFLDSYYLGQGKVDGHAFSEQIDSCSLNTDDDNYEGGSCYSEVDGAVLLANDTHFDDALRNILIERYVGSPGHTTVAEYIKSSLLQLGWQIETDRFQAYTPLGRKSFENIVAKLNPRASKVVAISCHYDSKYFKEFAFLGATDSAVPCAMMLNLAHTLRRQLEKLKLADYSLDLIFFDGEEAFKEWTHDDSLYGSRHLAAKMQQEGSLQRVKLLVLLDLLGAQVPILQSHFSNTDNEHRLLVQIEKKLRSSNNIKARTFFFEGQPVRYFQDVPFGFGARAHITIEDDHVPFFQKGVRVLHVIPTPFPKKWHKQGDNFQSLDMATIHDLNVILRAFILRTLIEERTSKQLVRELFKHPLIGVFVAIVVFVCTVLLLKWFKISKRRKSRSISSKVKQRKRSKHSATKEEYAPLGGTDIGEDKKN